MISSKPSHLYLTIVIVWWVLFTGIVYLGNLSYYVMEEKEFHFIQKLGYSAIWLLWIPFTFLTVRISRLFPINSESRFPGIGRLILASVIVVLLKAACDYLYIDVMRWLFFDKPLRGWTSYTKLISGPFHSNLVVYCGVLGAAFAYDFYVKLRTVTLRSSQLEAKLAQTELQSLKMQLQPHFLFNTHHSIVTLILQERNAEAAKMLTYLSDLLRKTIEKTDQQLASVKDEIETLNLYLSIQKVRFEDRLQIEIDIDPEALECKIPYLLLQPITENAIKHGIEPRSAPGHLKITLRKQQTELLIAIADNGPGFSQPEKLNSSSIGLPNTRSRLEQLYGKQSSFEINTGPETGTKITIKIPLSPSL